MFGFFVAHWADLLLPINAKTSTFLSALIGGKPTALPASKNYVDNAFRKTWIENASQTSGVINKTTVFCRLENCGIHPWLMAGISKAKGFRSRIVCKALDIKYYTSGPLLIWAYTRIILFKLGACIPVELSCNPQWCQLIYSNSSHRNSFLMPGSDFPISQHFNSIFTHISSLLWLHFLYKISMQSIRSFYPHRRPDALNPCHMAAKAASKAL